MRILLALISAVAIATVAKVNAADAPDMPHKNWEEPVKLDDHGYIRQWLVLGPINFGDKYNADDIDKDQIKDEAKLTPKAADKLKVDSQETQAGAQKTVQKELTWKALKTDGSELNLNKLFGLDSSENIGAYAVAYLEAPEEMKGIKFSLGSNDDCKVFLNGKKVHLFVGGRALEEDVDVVSDLTLKKGINVVIFKIWNDANDWGGCLRLLDTNGKPVKNVTTRLPK